MRESNVSRMTVTPMPSRTSTRALVAGEVRAWMARRDVLQNQLAEATGITTATLSRRLKAREERDSFTVDELDKIAAALRVPITQFFQWVDERPDPSNPGESNPGPIHYE